MGRYRLGKQSQANLVGVHPILAFAVYEAIERVGIDFGVSEGVRSVARQKKLVAKGVSKTMNSYHLYGLAVDLVPYHHGRYHWDSPSDFQQIATAMGEVIAEYGLPIEWGYEKWGWDMPHWQMTGYRKRYDIRKLNKRR